MEQITRRKFSLPVDEEDVSRDWAGRGYSCSWFADPPGREWNDFVHRSNEVVTVVEGRLRMTIAGESCIAEPGDEIFIPRHARHSVKNIHSATTRWLFGYD